MASKKQLLLELLATDKTGQATDSAAENLEKVAVAAEEASKATDNLGDQAAESTEEVERFGKSNRSAAEHSAELNHEIENVEKELHQLAVAFAEAETAADRADLSKSIRRTQSDLRNLNKSKSLVDDLIPGADEEETKQASRNIDELKTHIKGLKQAFLAAGTSEGRSFLSKAIKDAEGELGDLTKFAGDVAPSIGSKFAEAFSSIGEVAVPVLAGVAVAAAPAIGATISGAIIGAVGLGGVVGGFAIASRDPAVKKAASTMASSIGSELKDAAQPFVAVSIKGINELGGAVKGLDFEQIFADSAKNAGPLIDGITTAVEELGGALANIIHNSGPVIAELGKDFAGFGGALAGGLNSLADNGKQGADAMHQLFLFVNGTVTSVFALVNGLTEVYGALDKISGGGPVALLDSWAAASADVKDKSVGIAQALITQGIPAMNDYGDAVLTDGASLRELADAADAAANAQLGLFGDATAVAKAEDAVTAAVKKNGKTLDEHTKKGQDNRDALQTLGAALIRNTEDYRNLNGDGPKTDAVQESNRKAFLKAAIQIGKTKQQAIDLTNAIFGIPKSKSPVIKVSVTGKERLDATGHRIQSINSKSVTISVSVTGEERLDSLGHRIGGYRAGGGPVKKGKAYVVGEKRAELFVPDRDGTIIPSIDDVHGGSTPGTYGAGAGAGQAVMAGPTVIVVDPSRGDADFARAIAKMLRTDTSFRAAVKQYVK